MAVTHLAEKLKPVTPQLNLLHDMCFDFMKNRQKDIFELLNDDVCIIVQLFSNNNLIIILEYVFFIER